MEIRTVRRNPAPRATEGKKSVATTHKATEILRGRNKGGRPLGSKNKPKALIPKELAGEFLGIVKTILPEEYYNEMREAIRTGKNISTINEAKILLKLMGPPIWVRLIEEATPKESRFDDVLADEFDEGSGPSLGFDKDLNERLKVMLQFMQFVAKLEGDESESNNSQKPILEIIARRGLDSERIKFLVGVESGDVGGNTDGDRGATPPIRAVSGEIPERQIDVQDSQ